MRQSPPFDGDILLWSVRLTSVEGGLSAHSLVRTAENDSLAKAARAFAAPALASAPAVEQGLERPYLAVALLLTADNTLVVAVDAPLIDDVRQQMHV